MSAAAHTPAGGGLPGSLQASTATPSPHQAAQHADTAASLGAFHITHPAEIEALLQHLRDSGAAVVLATPAGGSLSARLWSLDAKAGRLHLGVDADEPQLPGLVAADEATAVSFLDQIQLQFSLQGLVLVRGADGTSLQADWPQALVRLQRRDSYRVKTSGRCVPSLRLRHPSMPDMPLQLRLLDVSVGGCALLLPQDVPDLQPGTCINHVAVQLDALTHFDGALLLHHVSALDGEAAPRRIGCSWAELSPAAERALLRYIHQTQKRQRLLART